MDQGTHARRGGPAPNSEIAEELNLPPVKIHCSVLAEDAVKSAIEDYRRKRAARTALEHQDEDATGRAS